jgi:hypothetical protein
MLAIHTKYIGPTNTRGSRIKAYTVRYSGSPIEVTIPYAYQAGTVEAHFEAVKELVKKHKLDWNLSEMRYGDSADGKGYSFCFACSIVKEASYA